MNKWKGERKEGMEGGRERRRDRLRQKSLTARPGLSDPLLPKFHKICPWLHLLWHYFGRIYLRIRYLIQLILYFYWLFVFSYVLFSWMKWLELIRFYSEIRNKKFFLKKKIQQGQWVAKSHLLLCWESMIHPLWVCPNIVFTEITIISSFPVLGFMPIT